MPEENTPEVPRWEDQFVDEEDELIGTCTECKSDNPDSYVENSPWYQAGVEHVPCKYCGGRLIVVSVKYRNAAHNRADIRRGIGLGHKEVPRE